jgi:hypothetical protein
LLLSSFYTGQDLKARMIFITSKFNLNNYFQNCNRKLKDMKINFLLVTDVSDLSILTNLEHNPPSNIMPGESTNFMLFKQLIFKEIVKS